jgi:hypothetical protein
VIAGYSYWGEDPNCLNSLSSATYYYYILLPIAFSYIDNRVGLAILAYDPSNNVAGRLDTTGTRYVVSIIYNSVNGSVVFTGQSGATITVPIIQFLQPIVFQSTKNAVT